MTLAKNKILIRHKYDIYFSESDKRWHTHLPDETKGEKRRRIARKNRADLETLIINFYTSEQKPTPKTLEWLYPQFKAYKARETSLNNANKLDWVWHKYCASAPILESNISDIKVIDLKLWYLDIIETYSLTNKQFKEVKSLFNMLFDFAIEKQIVSVNISRSVRQISYKKFRKPVVKAVDEQIFFQGEDKLVMETALEMYSATKNTAYLAIILNFYLALRVGELVAIKLTDINGATLKIQRQEVVLYEEHDGTIVRNGYTISDYTKSINSERCLPIVEKAKQIIDMIVQANIERDLKSDYLFLNKDGSRMNTHSINNVLNRGVNKRINIKQKGNHSIRKTTLSKMNASKEFTQEEICGFSGHKQVSTLQNSYLFLTDTLENRRNAYETALNY